jgi:hypothetical protein
MHCPGCGQQEVSDNVRFCSRCGFQLGAIKKLFAESSNAPAVIGQPGPKFLSQRKQDLLLGATSIYVAAVVTVLYSWVQPKGVIIFPLGMMWLGFSLFVLFFEPLTRVARKLFSEDTRPSQSGSSPLRNESSLVTKISPRGPALPPAQGVPLTAFGAPGRDPGEMVQQPSITERTTLGAPPFNPAPLFNQQRADTAEIYQPPSVTENTTKLLDKDS